MYLPPPARPSLHPPNQALPAGIGTIVTALIRSRKIFRRLETYIVRGRGQTTCAVRGGDLLGCALAGPLRPCASRATDRPFSFTACLQVYRMASSITILVRREEQ